MPSIVLTRVLNNEKILINSEHILNCYTSYIRGKLATFIKLPNSKTGWYVKETLDEIQEMIKKYKILMPPSPPIKTDNLQIYQQNYAMYLETLAEYNKVKQECYNRYLSTFPVKVVRHIHKHTHDHTDYNDGGCDPL